VATKMTKKAPREAKNQLGLDVTLCPHDSLTARLRKAIRDRAVNNNEFRGVAGAAVLFCQDPKPGRGYLAVVVQDGQMRALKLGEGVAEARSAIDNMNYSAGKSLFFSK
jgi:hypothetical protein